MLLLRGFVPFVCFCCTLSIRGTRYDQPMKFLERLAVLQKPEREPVEQLGMTRQRAHPAKVIGRLDQSSTEMVVPHAIHNRTARQQVVRTRNPLRKRNA